MLDASRAELTGASTGLWFRIVGSTALGLIMGAATYRLGMSTLGNLDRLGIVVVSVLAAGLGAFAFFNLGRAQRDMDRAARLFREACMCIVCGYDLRDLAPEDDGCLVCPECGAAWLATRLTASLATSPTSQTATEPTPALPQTASAPAASPPSAPTQAPGQVPGA